MSSTVRESDQAASPYGTEDFSESEERVQILLAEDDEETAEFVEKSLTNLGHLVTHASTGDVALQLGLSGSFHAIILDRMLPELDGLKVLQRMRAASVTTPVILLTAKGGIADRVAGLDAGADDYLVKPFAMEELIARLNALRRRPPMQEVLTELTFENIVMDLIHREVRRGNTPIHLQPKEFALLEVLMRNAGRIVTRAMLLEQVWNFHFDPQTNIVESHLSRMRAKIRMGQDEDLIETIRGLGYRLRHHD